jgi:hypothetical protein
MLEFQIRELLSLIGMPADVPECNRYENKPPSPYIFIEKQVLSSLRENGCKSECTRIH